MNATLTTTQLHHHRTSRAVLVVALVALAAALVGLGYAVQHAVTQGTTTATVVLPAQEWTSAYAAGSTVFAEQVPALAAQSLSMTSGYGVGSTTWAEQVGWAPAVRTLPHGVAPLEDEATWTSAYGPTSAVHHEQVPHGAAPFEYGTPQLAGTGMHPVLNAGALEALTSA